MPKKSEIPLKKLTIRLEEPVYVILRDYSPVPYSILLRFFAKKYVKSLLQSNPQITQKLSSESLDSITLSAEEQQVEERYDGTNSII